MGLLPPDSHNPEERRFVQELRRGADEVRYVRGIGIKGFASRQLRSAFARRSPVPGETPARLLIAPPRRLLYRLNVAWLRRQLIRLTNGRSNEWILWTRFPSPELVEAVDATEFARIVYEPIDRYDSSLDFTLAERRRIASAEQRLVFRSTVIAGGSEVAQRLVQAAGGSSWIPFGRDLGATTAVQMYHKQKHQIRVGVVAEFDWRVDAQLIAGVAGRRPDWKIVLVGPRAKRWGTELVSLKNIEFVGRVEPSAVSRQVRSFDVALIPYRLNDWTRACLPVKIYEYLAEGRPVVTTPLPELEPFSDVIDRAAPDEFTETIERAMRFDSEGAREARIKASTRFTLQDRARRSIALLQGTKVMVSAV